MVFGFGRKKTSEPSPAEPPQEMEVNIQEIPSLIKGLEGPKITAIMQEAKRLRVDIEECKQDIYNIIIQLESDTLKLDEVDKNLKAIGVRGKDAVVSTIKKETGAKLAALNKYEDVIELSNEVNQTLKRIGDVLGLHTRVMHVFARKYADKLKDEIANLAQDRNSLQQMINNHEKFKSDSKEILENIQKIHDLKRKKEQNTHRINEMVGERVECTKKISMFEQEISNTKSSPEYIRYLEEKNRERALSNEKIGIKAMIDQQFSKISRPLNKYSYVSSFDKPMKKLMETLISDPYQALSGENKLAIIEILQAVTKSIVAGNVSVKDSDRSAEVVEETVERLDEFLRLKSAYESKVLELENSLKIFDSKRLEEKERSLSKAKADLAGLESSYAKLEKEIADNADQVNAARSDLEKNLTVLMDKKSILRINC